MANPFEKRATEYLRNEEAFLAVVTPEPLETFFQKAAEDDRLYDRLVTVVGTPGSGKTTMARLFLFQTLQTLLRNPMLSTYKPLIDEMVACRAISDDQPVVAGARVPLEAEYREFWEFPYAEDLKTSLMIALLQARTVLAWMRGFEASGVALERVRVVPRADADAATSAIGGTTAPEIRERARGIERAIYKISAALVPPDVVQIDHDAVGAYQPFDVVESFLIDGQGRPLVLRPLAIFDDAHILHPAQLTELLHWLARRETRVGRWVLTRLDALTPAQALLEGNTEGVLDSPAVKQEREITSIRLQGGVLDRSNQRRAFRKMAKDMANRYLSQMEVFTRHGLASLSDLLSTEPEPMPTSKREQLGKRLDTFRRKHGITEDRRAVFEQEIARYFNASGDQAEDVRLAMLSIFMERYLRRTPQTALFDDDSEDAEPNRPLTADAEVAEGARIQLMHQFDRPYYFGIDALCDVSSENAEQFLRLAARLVSQSETQLVRGKSPTLTSGVQHRLLRQRAQEIIREWDFPEHQLVRRLTAGIAKDCIARTLAGNAPLGAGANAIGIPQEEFNDLPKLWPALARVLQFAVGYNAVVLVPNHGTKGRIWCLVELGGVLLLSHGLSPRRGGFVERRAADLARMLADAQ